MWRVEGVARWHGKVGGVFVAMVSGCGPVSTVTGVSTLQVRQDGGSFGGAE